MKRYAYNIPVRLRCFLAPPHKSRNRRARKSKVVTKRTKTHLAHVIGEETVSVTFPRESIAHCTTVLAWLGIRVALIAVIN